MESLRDAAISIVRTLTEAGHVAYLAGGCVRDRLLGIEPKDYDVATDAPPEVVKRLLRGARLVGEAFGVVMAPVTLPGGERRYVEVATFREESGYSDGRRPDHVSFTDAQHDARRRDFTINGLFEDPLRGEVIDYVGGQDDLRTKMIRAIGDPSDRFGEDYLRMLRAVRFAARLGFEIEEATARAIRNNARYLGQISRERIGQELQWMLLGKDPARAAELIQQLHLDAPTLNEDHATPPLPTVRAVGARPYATMLAAWMVDRHPHLHASQLPAVIQRWRRAVCMSNEDRDALAATLDIAATLTEWAELTLAQRKRLLAREHADQGLALFSVRCDSVRERQRIESDVAALRAEGVAPEPWVSGDDLIALGRDPGPQFKRWLDEVYDAQLEGRVSDRDEALALLSRLSQ